MAAAMDVPMQEMANDWTRTTLASFTKSSPARVEEVVAQLRKGNNSNIDALRLLDHDRIYSIVGKDEVSKELIRKIQEAAIIEVAGFRQRIADLERLNSELLNKQKRKCLVRGVASYDIWEGVWKLVCVTTFVVGILIGTHQNNVEAKEYYFAFLVLLGPAVLAIDFWWYTRMQGFEIREVLVDSGDLIE